MQSSYPDQNRLRDENTRTGGQWDDPVERGNQDYTGNTGGNTYSPQSIGQSGYEYNTSQEATGPGGIAVQSDRYPNKGQQGGPGMATIGGQTAGYVDRQPEDDEYGAVGASGGHTSKPSMTSRVKGAAEKLAGKITGDPVKEARGREREEGTF